MPAPSRDIRRFALSVLLLWTLAIALSIAWDVYETRNSLRNMALNQAILMLEKDLLYRRWAAMHGGVYAPVSAYTQPNPHLQHIPERDITTPSGRKLTLVNPAYMNRQVHEISTKNHNAVAHITSLHPLRAENRPDPWEQAALKRLQEQNLRETSGVELLDGKPYMRYLRAVITEKSCLKCHAHQGYRAGDIRGGISVSVALTPFREEERRQAAQTALGHGTVWLLGVLFIMTVRRRLTAGIIREELSAAALTEARIQILQQEKLASIGQLAAGVAHEINNPIGFVTSNLMTLKRYLEKLTSYTEQLSAALRCSAPAADQAALDEQRRTLKIDHILIDAGQLIAESLEGAERVRDIVTDLNFFANDRQTEFTACDVNRCIRSALRMVSGEYKEVAPLLLDLQEPLPMLTANNQQLMQVVANLVANAAHAVRQKQQQGLIHVRSWQEGEQLCFSVSDNGHGIPEEIRNRIFDPFFTTKEIGAGTGLGLSVSNEIIRKHGGKLSVQSQVGLGSTFTVCLPFDHPQPDERD